MNTHRIKELVAVLNAANRAYYHENSPTMSDREYDTLYDELLRLEEETGISLAGSPTQKVGYEVVSGLTKAEHTTPMLSLDKTKNPQALAEFLGSHSGLLSWKLDGLTVVLRYNGGELQQALTRGNGYIGEDITHNARVFRNVPLTVPYKGRFDLRGEAVISIRDFEAINEREDQKYKNPRNLCSGAVRQLNSETAAKRQVLFFAFSLEDLGGSAPNPPQGAHPLTPTLEPGVFRKSEQLAWLVGQGFEVAEFEIVTAENVVDAVARFKEKIPAAEILSDGLVLTYDDIAYSESLGATSKFPRDSIAFKWADELAETELIAVEWNTSRTGLINPVAIFAPVEIEGTQVSRASLHNVSILRKLDLRPGDKITVYKANMIIPQIDENLSANSRGQGDAAEEPESLPSPNSRGQGDLSPCGGIGGNAPKVLIPETCPVCSSPTEIVGEPEVLYCTSPGCGAQKVRALSHFVSRDALNIAGLSEQTLEKLISAGMVENFLDLFSLQKFEDEIKQMEGFGQKSYDNLAASIETAKDVPLPNFIHGLGIRHVGLAGAKLLCDHFSHDGTAIAQACAHEDFLENLLEIKGFGEAIANSLHRYFSQETNLAMFTTALEILRIAPPPQKTAENRTLDGLTFVITGDVSHFKNRKELQGAIENAGGRVTGSVTAKTSYLINNDTQSQSGKNKKAAQLGVKIITEDEFLEMLE